MDLGMAEAACDNAALSAKLKQLTANKMQMIR
jgi:hypothetical protein